MVASRFLLCLAATLREETGYLQPVGGPYVRLVVTDKVNARRRKRNEPELPRGASYVLDARTLKLTGRAGSIDLPRIPDGMAFDDDQSDSGGRTGMGILQREFDPWCRLRGKDRRDVWSITDDELTALYHEQYWQAVRADELPPGVDLAVFDAGVNCGVGTGARILQRALGLTADGHIGTVTLAAASAAEPAELIAAVTRFRIAYHRQCRTFRTHGANWLERDERIGRVAAGMAAAGAQEATQALRPRVPVMDRWDTETAQEAAPEPAAGLSEPAAPAPRAVVAESTPATSKTLWSAALTGITGFLIALREFLSAVGPAVQSPWFWLALAVIGLAIVTGGERLKKFAREAFA